MVTKYARRRHQDLGSSPDEDDPVAASADPSAGATLQRSRTAWLFWPQRRDGSMQRPGVLRAGAWSRLRLAGGAPSLVGGTGTASNADR